MGFGNYGIQPKEDKINYEVIKEFGTISTAGKFTRKLRLVSWNGNEPKFDLRDWSEKDGVETCRAGITLTSTEIESLYKILQEVSESEEAVS